LPLVLRPSESDGSRRTISANCPAGCLITMLVVVVIAVMTACLPIGLRWHRRRERVLRHLSDRLREFAELQVELSERRVLLNRPWEEDLLHWAHEGGAQPCIPRPARRPAFRPLRDIGCRSP